MEIVSLILLTIILVFIFKIKNTLSEKFNKLDWELQQIKRSIEKQTEKEKLAKPLITEERKEEFYTPPSTIKPPVEEKQDYWETNFKIIEDNKPIEEDDNSIEISKSLKVDDELGNKHSFVKAKAQPSVEQKPSFFERNPDLEKFIGENLVSKIGIAILVIGIGIFVKYAIDNNWIGPVGRVSIGVFCGAILVGIAHYLRNSYKAFSSVLIGGGLSIFYFTFTLAYHQFQLIPQTATFIIMIIITAFAVVISLLYDRQELAIIAMIGGFSAPFLVSDGSGNYATLFIYLIILNVGLLVIALKKAWRLQNLLAFIFTTIIFVAWLFTVNASSNSIYQNGFVFATIFYLLFFAINIAHNIMQQKKFIASDFSILLANTAIYFAVGLYCLNHFYKGNLNGVFSAILGGFNLAITHILFKKKKIDTNILYLLIGITLTFISLIAPLQLHGNYITLFWASEAVLIYWLYTKTTFKILNLGSVIIWLAMLISLIMDVFAVYKDTTLYLPIVINKGFITLLYTSIATYLIFIVRQKNNNHSFPLKMSIFRDAAFILLYCSGAIEIIFQFVHAFPEMYFQLIYLALYTTFFVLAFISIAKKVQPTFLNNSLVTALYSLNILFSIIIYPNTYQLQASILTTHQHNILFIAHWVGAILVLWMFYQLIQHLHLQKQLKEIEPVTLALVIALLIILSVETHFIVNSIFYSNTNSLAFLQRVFIKAVLPILWGTCSFAMIWIGMKFKFRFIRIIALGLLSITLIKLFAYDISNIPVAGKIAAFICLGILLLIVSFMYQRLKKIISNDEEAIQQ